MSQTVYFTYFKNFSTTIIYYLELGNPNINY